LGHFSVAAIVAAGVTAAGLVTPQHANAEGLLRIAGQFGVVYLLLNVARDQ
jgi:NitT/TauT family transport system substrate-binding protein